MKLNPVTEVLMAKVSTYKIEPSQIRYYNRNKQTLNKAHTVKICFVILHTKTGCYVH